MAPEPEAPVTPLSQPATFSVVIAAYQAAATIGDAVRSALAQTEPPEEIIVCDDGSTDDLAAALAPFGTAVRLLRAPHLGAGAARNTAVRAASADFVVVLDADDVFDDRRLEALGRLAMRRPDLDMLTTDAIVEADGVPVRHAYHDGWPFPTDSQRIAILQRNFVFGLVAVRRSRWLEVGGNATDLSRGEDWDLWLRLILSGSRVGLVAAPLARYRLTAGTLSADRRGLVAARLAVLERAAARSDLSREERRLVRKAAAQQRREQLLRDAEAALAASSRRARVAQARVLTAPGFRARTRAGAALALAAPSVARHRKQRRAGETVEIGTGLRVPITRAAGQDRPPPT